MNKIITDDKLDIDDIITVSNKEYKITAIFEHEQDNAYRLIKPIENGMYATRQRIGSINNHCKYAYEVEAK